MSSFLNRLFSNVGICMKKKSNKSRDPVVISRKPKRVPSLTTIADNRLYKVRIEERAREEDKILEELSQNIELYDEFLGRGNQHIGEQLQRKLNRGYASGFSTSPSQSVIVA